jgi:hypothetical protein
MSALWRQTPVRQRSIQWVEASCGSGTDEVQPWNGGGEPPTQIRVAVHPAHSREQFGRQEIVPGDIHIVACAQQHMIHPAFRTVIELQSDLVSRGLGRLHKPSCADLDRSQSCRKPSRPGWTNRTNADFVFLTPAEWGATNFGYATSRLIPAGPTSYFEYNIDVNGPSSCNHLCIPIHRSAGILAIGSTSAPASCNKAADSSALCPAPMTATRFPANSLIFHPS